MRVLLLAAFVQACLAYPYFQEKLPNGDRIPHPCKPNFIWHGVGHNNAKGGGETNPFGEDFKRNGFVWDKCICERDSDGDGKTNGEELGDPNCKWKTGDVAEVVASSKLSHPGICDPHESEKCASNNNWDYCTVEEFHCPALEAEGVKNFTLKFPKTQVPSEATTYMCMVFEIPVMDPTDLHIIGSKAQIDNANVMHHITVSSCPSSLSEDFKKKYKTPQPCDGTSMTQCSGGLGGWTVGMDGYCIPDEYGMAFGKKVDQVYAILEFHWNNPEKRSDYMDGSGITFFYENKKREHDAAGAGIGPLYLEIPPAQSEWEEYFICQSECTQSLKETKYISNILPHMHYMGRRFKMEQWRDGKKFKDLVTQDDYRYDSPKEEYFNPPIEVLAGDEFRVHCYFNSKGATGRTYYGEGTFDEMCFGLFTYYPARAIDTLGTMSCFGYKNTSWFCDGNLSGNSGIDLGTTPGPTGSTISSATKAPTTTATPTTPTPQPACDTAKYWNQTFGAHFATLAAVCDPLGDSCEERCSDAVKRVQEHPCYHQDMEIGMMRSLGYDEAYGKPFRQMYHSCKLVPKDKTPAKEDKPTGTLCNPTGTSGAAHVTSAFLAVMLASFLAIMAC